MSDQLPELTYDQLAGELLDGELITDPWFEGAPRFATSAVVLDAARWSELSRVAEQTAAVYDEACRLVTDEPELLESFFGLTPYQALMWNASAPLWHGIARVDVFATADGPAITEINCDTPTGEAEAVELGRIFGGRHPDLHDPNAQLPARLLQMMDAAHRHLTDDAPDTIGLLYPTEFTDDLSLVRAYRRWFTDAGRRVVLGSPYNLARDDQGHLTLFEEPIGLMVRHYKTDWWGERSGAWDDETVDDPHPLDGPLSSALSAAIERKCTIVNPFGSVLPQNKRMMAFFWEHLHRFTASSQATIERFVPYTARLESIHTERLLAERASWVLKSDYGAEGDEVVLGAAVDEETWRSAVLHAKPGRWVAQRYFQAEVGPLGTINYGVYLIAGKASGLYLRAQQGATDVNALSLAVLLRP